MGDYDLGQLIVAIATVIVGAIIPIVLGCLAKKISEQGNQIAQQSAAITQNGTEISEASIMPVLSLCWANDRNEVRLYLQSMGNGAVQIRTMKFKRDDRKMPQNDAQQHAHSPSLNEWNRCFKEEFNSIRKLFEKIDRKNNSQNRVNLFDEEKRPYESTYWSRLSGDRRSKSFWLAPGNEQTLLIAQRLPDETSHQWKTFCKRLNRRIACYQLNVRYSGLRGIIVTQTPDFSVEDLILSEYLVAE